MTTQIVEINGKEYQLKQEAYLTGTHEAPYYEALAIDEKGNQVMVIWEIAYDTENEEDRCNWYEPSRIAC